MKFCDYSGRLVNAGEVQWFTDTSFLVLKGKRWSQDLPNIHPHGS